MIRAALCLVLAVAACARPDPGLRATLPHPAVPEGVTREDVALTAGDGMQLYAQRWRGGDAPRAVLVVVHGLKDHSDRYAGMAIAAAQAGYAVYALDLRGHARSPGARVTIDRFERFVDDVARLVAVARGEAPGLPVFVIGHSMGGVITARLAETRPEGIAGVILSAPALGIDAPAFQAAAIMVAGGPGLGRFPGFEPPTKEFASSREVTDDMARDPLIHNAKAPVHTASELVGAAGKAWEDAAELRVPIVILHGTGDRLTAPAASRDFLHEVGTADRTLLLYEDAWHDLAHEPIAAKLTADVIAWMDARHAGPVASVAPLPERKLRGDRMGLVERHHLRGARIVDGGGTSLDATLTFAAGRTVMIGATLEGRLGLTGLAGSGAHGSLGIGTRLGTHGWLMLGPGYARYGGLNRLAAQAELALGPRQLPFALHLRGLAITASGDVRIETEATLRVLGNRIFWGRGRRGAGLALGARTVDGTEGLTITLGFESTGFD